MNDELDYTNDYYNSDSVDLGSDYDEPEAVSTPLLDRFTTDLTQKAMQRPQDYEVYGRDAEVEDIIISLMRKSKNSPLLIGEAGVGKTAIVEGVALRIVRGQVPPELANLTVRVLELSDLMANQQEDSFLSRFKGIIGELVKTKGENLLFIDEIHTLMGAGADGQSLDAGNTLKPALARGEIQIIGATTIDEYHETIENDRALQRRFQNIQVDEPTHNQTLKILKGVRKNYEEYQNVTITDEALEVALDLSIRYIPDRFLPDKALDLIDEASTLANAFNLGKVTAKEVAEVLKRWTGIPVTTILKDDNDRLDGIEEKLRKRVKGQEFAIHEVADTITVAKAGLQDETKPLGSFLLLGTTGVGKTELAKAVAETVFDDENAMIRIDMSEYSQPGSSTRLIGTRKTKGVLTEAVKHKPYSIVLFDELEKGDREVHDLLLQILDDGRLTDGTGRLISFKNTIVFMTTNIGAENIRDNADLKGEVDQLTVREYNQFMNSVDVNLRNEFRPEFINRIDHKIVFNMLARPVIKEIAIKNLEELQERMLQQNATLIYDEKLLDYLADNGTDVYNGARPLARLINRVVLAPIARKLVVLPKQSGLFYEFTVVVEGKPPGENEDGEVETIEKRKLKVKVREIRK